MSPQKILQNGIKPDRPNKRDKDVKPRPVNSRGVNRTPIATTLVTSGATTLMSLISTLEFPPLGAQLSDFLRPAKKWCIKQGTPVINSHLKKSTTLNDNDQEMILWAGPIPAYSLKKGNVLTVHRQSITIPGDVPVSSWSEVTYEETSYDRTEKKWVKSSVTGWVNDGYLDDYHEKFPDFEVVIPHATKNSNDPQQFMTIVDEGYSEFNIRTNMCGELCVAFVVEKDIDAVLEAWNEQGKMGYYQSLVGKGQNKTTTQVHLKDMLDRYYTNAEDIRSFRGDLLTVPLAAPSTDPNYPHASNAIQERLMTHSLITLVRIDLNTGELKPTEQPGQRNHWIVLDKITQDGNRVVIYNPFPNKRQEYSFAEFFKSLGSNPTSGWWVKRNQISRNFFAENFRTMKQPLKVVIANPNPAYSAAQYIDVEGKKKTNLCGEFCVALIVKDSIEGVLETWKKDRKLLYEDIIGNNKTTGTGDLTTILKSYGYNNEDDIEGFSALLGDPYTKQYLPSPGRIAKMLETHYLIAGVNIDGSTGRLKPPPAVPHWIVVDKITPVGRIAGGNGGWVEVYNPFSNSHEEYSYSEFANSIDPFAKEYGFGWSGLWVKRTIVPKFETPVVVTPSGEVGQVQGRIIENSSRPGRWTEGQVLAAIRLQSKAGKPINRIAADLVEKSGWQKEDILALFKTSTTVGTTAKWTETQLWAEMQKLRQAGKPVSKIVGELAKISGWKSQDIFDIFRKNFKAGGGERWAEDQMLSAIQLYIPMIWLEPKTPE